MSPYEKISLLSPCKSLREHFSHCKIYHKERGVVIQN